MREELNNLLVELGKAYDESDIKKFCEANGHKWNYSLITSTMEKNGPLIIGFNWGAEQNESYKPQSRMEKSNFENEDIGSLSRIYPYCREYFGPDFLSKVSQSNYCFFRSKKESQISNRDIHLCGPIFNKMIEIVHPSYVLCFSSKLRDKMMSGGNVVSPASHDIHFKSGNRNITYTAIKGFLNSNVPIKFLPHPQYRINNAVRNEAWDFCCG